MNRRQLIASVAAMTTISLALPVWAQDEPLKVGFIYVGPVSDGGWTYQHDQGRLAVEEEYGDRVETTYLENVPEGVDAERALTQLALAGNDVIYATSFGYMDAVINVAAKFPDIKFEHNTGYKRTENVGTYDGRFYEGRAVTGTIAGRMTQSNKIGYIATFPIPEVIQGINSAYIHAKKVNPDVEMRVVWAYTWFDPAKEADAANALMAEGVDVILQHTNSTAPLAQLQQQGKIGFGQAADMASFAPTPRVSSVYNNWGAHYVKSVGRILDGTWQPEAVWGGIGDGIVAIGEITEAVPAEVKAEAEALRDKIAAGEYHPFTGPLNKADGSAWLAEGQTATDEELSGMNFFVEGINAELPQ